MVYRFTQKMAEDKQSQYTQNGSIRVLFIQQTVRNSLCRIHFECYSPSIKVQHVCRSHSHDLKWVFVVAIEKIGKRHTQRIDKE